MKRNWRQYGEGGKNRWTKQKDVEDDLE